MSSDWSVESLGRGVFLFRWLTGFYLSPFVVGARGVTAFDPISDTAAVAYRAAIASVTDLPITRLGPDSAKLLVERNVAGIGIRPGWLERI